MRILLTNDDGIDAPGLTALFESVQLAASHDNRPVEIIVVAPDRGRSECSHSIETSQPLRICTVREGWTSVNGTPVDCVRVAVTAMGLEPDLVLSGVNAGANLGVNLMISGTFAAAREASSIGIPAMAVSQYRRHEIPRSWTHVPHWLLETLIDFWNADGEQYEVGARLWNVNLPADHDDPSRIPSRVSCEIDRCPIERNGSMDPEGTVRFEWDFHGRPRESGRDVAECFGGQITISRVSPFFDSAH
ncbi:MAG: 5'/3'-nucleotidase SurE [Planctomycetota bacterium]